MNDNMLMTMFGILAVAITSFLTYLGLRPEFMYLYAFLLVADYMSGVLKAMVLNSEVSYKKGRDGIIVKMLMWVIPIILASTTKIVGVEAQVMFEWGVGLLAVSEAYSFVGNIYTMKTGKYFPKVDALAILGNYLRKWLKSKLDTLDHTNSVSIGDNDDKPI